MVGKIRLALTPWLNHSWHVALYVTTRGQATSQMFAGGRSFQIDFDFIEHVLRMAMSSRDSRTIALRPMTGAEL